MQNNGDVLLTIEGLRIEAAGETGPSTIVDGVDLTLRRGEVVGLVGESGAGKSTIGLAAMGYSRDGCRITGGKIVFDGIDLRSLGEAKLRGLHGSRIAYVAQSAAASFNPAHRLLDQTIETTVRHQIMSRADAKARAIDLYSQMQLPTPALLANRFPHQVSGGQLQRAMTAMAMLCHPDLIVFDEPTTALDVTTQVEVLAAIRHAIERSGAAALYITHDLAVVAQMAHRIMVLRNGRTVEQGPTRTILNQPENEYTKRLWAAGRSTLASRRTEPPVLWVQGLAAGYDRLQVLRDVSFEVPRGRTVAVVGESGSGKSTLARVIAGLLPAQAGRVATVDGPLPSAASSRRREDLRRIQLIHQSADTSVNPRHTVREIIGRPLELFNDLYGEARDRRIRSLMEQTELDPQLANRFPSELSGGQKQRVSVARALAASPELIICDEVTSALDQLVQESVLDMLMTLQAEEKVSLLFITHDIGVVRTIADEVIVMHRGQVVEQGTKDDILSCPRDDYTKRLLSSVPKMDPDWLTNLLEGRIQTTQSANADTHHPFSWKPARSTL